MSERECAMNLSESELNDEMLKSFEVSVDPFYSESNMAHLRRGIQTMQEGKGVEHDIIEVDE